MCGIAGIVDLKRQTHEGVLTDAVTAMTKVLSHRGPDDEAVWVDHHSGVALGHRRLAVVDLSANGRQPMVSPAGRYVLDYNGEIYNGEELRHTLQGQGHRFRGHSDTEVMLAAIEHWGRDRALPQLNGMFAFALWDKRERVLTLVRDRLGEKPLYYAWTGDTFLFGSELKALRAHPGFSPDVNRDALALYFRHNCVPAPHSIYTGVTKLPPGTFLTVSTREHPCRPTPTPYWSAREVAEAGIANPLRGSAEELADELEHLLRHSVKLRMHADVPLGAFLSGGIDSSTVVALMQEQSARKVRTFTIGFEDVGYDESVHAARVASHLGTEHVELSLTPSQAIEVIPRLPVVYDEPFADSSQIPTLLVSELARRDVTVTLSGDGGDELFGGYNRYAWCQPIWRKIRRVPLPLRRAAASALARPSPERWDALFDHVGQTLPRRLRLRNPGSKMQKLAGVTAAKGLDDMYLTLVSHWKDPRAVLRGGGDALPTATDPTRWPDLDDPVASMMYMDLVTYLPDDILTKLDRASMGVSLEARVPMLDHRLVEFAWKLPLSMKLRHGQGKWLLRQVLHRYVPEALVDRPKAGFGLPVGQWLRGPLRDWAEHLLHHRRVRQEGFLEPQTVDAVWKLHLSGKHDFTDQLWGVLMFQAWLDSNHHNPTVASTARSPAIEPWS